MSFTRRTLLHPTDDAIVAAVRARRAASIRALCGDLWPELPFLPALPGQDAARGARFCWRFSPPLPDGRRTSMESPAEWLFSRCEALVRRGRLRHAPMGQHRVIDLIAQATYAALEPPLESGALQFLALNDRSGLSSSPVAEPEAPRSPMVSWPGAAPAAVAPKERHAPSPAGQPQEPLDRRARRAAGRRRPAPDPGAHL